MIGKYMLAAMVLAAVGSSAANAEPADDLKAKGFAVVYETNVMGNFEGCDRDLPVPLKSGGVFTCSSFGYMHAQNPKAVLLKNKQSGRFKLVIGKVVFDGVYKPQA